MELHDLELPLGPRVLQAGQGWGESSPLASPWCDPKGSGELGEADLFSGRTTPQHNPWIGLLVFVILKRTIICCHFSCGLQPMFAFCLFSAFAANLRQIAKCLNRMELHSQLGNFISSPTTQERGGVLELEIQLWQLYFIFSNFRALGASEPTLTSLFWYLVPALGRVSAPTPPAWRLWAHLSRGPLVTEHLLCTRHCTVSRVATARIFLCS